MTNLQRTLVLLKPDAVQRRLVGDIISRYERKNLQLEQLQMRHIDRAFAARHYAEHVGKPYFDALTDFITSGALIAMVWSGDDAIAVVRAMNGATDPATSTPGTIRGDYSLSAQRNLVHASDSVESAVRELDLWFPEAL